MVKFFGLNRCGKQHTQQAQCGCRDSIPCKLWCACYALLARQPEATHTASAMSSLSCSLLCCCC
jgi:hypothetical protein